MANSSKDMLRLQRRREMLDKAEDILESMEPGLDGTLSTSDLDRLQWADTVALVVLARKMEGLI